MQSDNIGFPETGLTDVYKISFNRIMSNFVPGNISNRSVYVYIISSTKMSPTTSALI